MRAFKSLLRVHLQGIFKNQKNKNTLLMIILTCFLLFFFGITYGYIFHMYFEDLNEPPLGSSMMMALGFFAATITGALSVKNLLFNSNDQELLMKLPVAYKTIIGVKVLTIVIESLGIIFLLSVASLCISLIAGTSSLLSFLIGLLLILSLGLLSSGVSMLLGYLYSSFKARFRIAGKIFGALSILLALGLAYLYIQFMMSSATSEGRGPFDALANLLRVRPFRLLPEILLGEDLLMAFILLASSGLLLALMVALFSTTYRTLSSRLNVAPREKPRALETKTSSPFRALVRKDLLKLIKTPYFLVNAAFLPLLMIVGIIMIIINPDYLKPLEEVEKTFPLIQLIPLLLVSMAGSAQISAVIISLERHNFWILKTLPVTEKLIITAKAMPQILMTALLQVMVTLLGLFMLQGISPLSWILSLIMGLLWTVSNSMVGVLINLNYPKLDAENETEIIKRSISTLLMLLYTLVSTSAFFFLSFVFFLIIPTAFLWPLLLLSGVYTYLIVAFVFKKGPTLFQKL